MPSLAVIRHPVGARRVSFPAVSTDPASVGAGDRGWLEAGMAVLPAGVLAPSPVPGSPCLPAELQPARVTIAITAGTPAVHSIFMSIRTTSR
ncbi:MAG: hypothetical protein J2P28_13065, partial [Actinobacteria bacterium]|nr:hypothetical protein [Actinomycetota bacterium]